MQPLRPHPKPEDDLKGRDAERGYMVRKLTTEVQQGHLRAFALPDFVAVDKHGSFFMGEFKRQDVFEPPPFEGHGLPDSQRLRYLALREHALVSPRTLLWVNDREAGYDYFQWLDVLEQSEPEPITTNGRVKTPRRVYPLTAFERLSNSIRMDLSA